MRRRGGVSLVEILLVSGLIAAALIPLYDMLTSSERGSKSSLHRVRATNYAADLLETLKAIPYDRLPETEESGGVLGWPDHEVADHVVVAAGGGPPLDLGAKIQPITGRVEDFARYLSIREVSRRDGDEPWGALKRLVVTIRWKEIMSGKKTESELRMVYLASPEGAGAP